MTYQDYSSANEPDSDLFPTEPIVYAGFWERVGASLLDGLILLVPNLILIYGLPEPLGRVLSAVMVWLYSAFLESGQGQATLGKKAMGLKVINGEGQQISFGQATGRHFGKIISTLIIFI